VELDLSLDWYQLEDYVSEVEESLTSTSCEAFCSTTSKQDCATIWLSCCMYEGH